MTFHPCSCGYRGGGCVLISNFIMTFHPCSCGYRGGGCVPISNFIMTFHPCSCGYRGGGCVPISNFIMTFHPCSCGYRGGGCVLISLLLSNLAAVVTEEEDVFQCGKCKKQFTMLSAFVSHKQTKCTPAAVINQSGGLRHVQQQPQQQQQQQPGTNPNSAFTTSVPHAVNRQVGQWQVCCIFISFPFFDSGLAY